MDDNPFAQNDPRPSGDNPFAQNDPKPTARLQNPVKKNYGKMEAIGAAKTNFVPSAVNAAKNMRDALVHPIDSLTTLGKIGAGAVINLHPTEVKKMITDANDPRINEAVDTANAVGGVYAERYGDRQRIINTFAEDPVGLSADLSMLLMGGAGAARGVAAVTGKGAKVANALSAASTVTNPMSFGGLASVPSRVVQGAGNVVGLTKAQTASNALKAVAKYSDPRTYANKVGEGMRHVALGPKANLVLNEAEDPIAVLAQLKQNQQIVPGSVPNPGQAAAGAGKTRWSSLQGAVDKRMPTEGDALAESQHQAQLGHLKHIGHTPEIYEAHGRARAAQSARDYGVSDPIMSAVDPDLVRILSRPHSSEVVRQAEMLAGEKGHRFGSGNNLSGRDIHYIKLAFDTLAKKRRADVGGITDAVHDAIVGTRSDFLKWASQPHKNPAYDVGRKNYAANSQVMDRMLFGQHLSKILQEPLTESFTADMRAKQFAAALRDPVNNVIKNHAVKRATGNEYAVHASDLMTPEEMDLLHRIRDDLGRAEVVIKQGAKASARYGNNLNTAAADWILPGLIHGQGKASAITRIFDERIAKQVSNAMQTQKGAVNLVEGAIRRKGAVDSAAKNINRVGNVVATPGVYNALNYFNNAEYQPPALGNEPIEQDWSGRPSNALAEQGNHFINKKRPPTSKPTKKNQSRKSYTEKPMP